MSLVAVHPAVTNDPLAHVAEHVVHACGPPSDLNVPALHPVHCPSDVAVAVAVSYAPSPHTVAAVHEKLPTSALYVPGSPHAAHDGAATAGWKLAAHSHAMIVPSPPYRVTDPAGHATHPATPSSAWYVPAAHAVHVALDPMPDHPAGHATSTARRRRAPTPPAAVAFSAAMVLRYAATAGCSTVPGAMISGDVSRKHPARLTDGLTSPATHGPHAASPAASVVLVVFVVGGA